MHTLVIWATAVSLTPLAVGVAWEALILFREAMSPPAANGGRSAPSQAALPNADPS